MRSYGKHAHIYIPVYVNILGWTRLSLAVRNVDRRQSTIHTQIKCGFSCLAISDLGHKLGQANCVSGWLTRLAGTLRMRRVRKRAGISAYAVAMRSVRSVEAVGWCRLVAWLLSWSPMCCQRNPRAAFHAAAACTHTHKHSRSQQHIIVSSIVIVVVITSRIA